MSIIKNIICLTLLPVIYVYPQFNIEQALRKGGWSGGLADWIGWENFNISKNVNNVDEKSKLDGFNFILNFSQREYRRNQCSIWI